MKFNNGKEMYDYIESNKLGYEMMKSSAAKHCELLLSKLQADEEILVPFLGLHNYLSPTQHDKNFAYALTNKRFVLAQKRLIGEAYQSILLDNLNDITYNRGLLGGVLTVDTMKEKFNVYVQKKYVENIYDEIHENLQKLESNSSKSSNLDDILKFKQLLDAGAITQEEFETKKAELLK